MAETVSGLENSSCNRSTTWFSQPGAASFSNQRSQHLETDTFDGERRGGVLLRELLVKTVFQTRRPE